MKRRDFLKSVGAGLAVGTGLNFLSIGEAQGSGGGAPQKPYDLAMVMGGEPEEMFDRGIAAMGGMGRYIKAGQKVVVKPNIGWDKAPELAANTNPKLVGQVVKACLAAGAKEVIVFDNTCDNWKKAYATSGIEKAAKEAGAKVITGNSERDYKPVNIPQGKVLKQTKVHEKILECDVLVNIPILKHHSGAQVTFAMKNLMGIVWDRRWWHRNDLQQCIADMVTYRKPELNIVDAYRIMERNGPRGVSLADVSLKKAQIISADIVAADAAAAMVFDKKPEKIGHIKIASEMGLGEMDLSKLNISRIRV